MHTRGHLLISLALLILLSSVSLNSDEEYDDDPSEIVDDYNEPIPLVKREGDELEDSDIPEEDRFSADDLPTDDKFDSDIPKGPDFDDDDDEGDGSRSREEPEEDERVRNDRRNVELAVNDQEPPPQAPPQSPPEPAKKKLPDVRNLMVKVYRGPTKEINDKPFASWGYFIKYPSDNNVSSAPATPGKPGTPAAAAPSNRSNYSRVRE